MKTKLNKYIMVLMALVAVYTAKAQKINYKASPHYDLSALSQSQDFTIDPGHYKEQFKSGSTQLNAKAKKAILIVRLHAGKERFSDNGSGFTDQTYSCKVHMYDDNNQERNFIKDKYLELTVDADKPTAVVAYDFTEKFNNAHLVSKFTFKQQTASPSTPAPDNWVTFEYSIEWQVDVRETGGGLPTLFPIAPSTTKISTPIVNLDWNSYGLEFQNYRIDVLKLENIGYPGSTNDEYLKCDVDWSKAMSFYTWSSETDVDFKPTQGKGYYAWRAVSIGSYYDGGVDAPKNVGYAPSFSSPITIPDVNNIPASAVNFIFYYEDPDDNINYSISKYYFDGKGETKEIVEYANKLKYPQQTQVYLPSLDQRVLTNSRTDLSGRNAVEFLPQPVDGRSFSYDIDGISTQNGSVYTRDKFDLNLKIEAPDEAGYLYNNSLNYYDGNTALTGQSRRDQHDFYMNVASAEGYPYERTVYYNDGAGRPKKVAKPGKMRSFDKNHYQEFFYGNPSDEELVKLFGKMAPKANSVTKKAQIDENGVVSFTYKNSSGEVIATAVGGDTPNNLYGLDQSNNTINSSVNDLVEGHVKLGNDLVGFKRITLLQDQTVNFNTYLIDCETISTTGCVDLTCKYDLEVIVKPVDNPTHTTYSFSKSAIQCSASPVDYTGFTLEPGATTTGATVSLQLKRGSYIIEKRLTPSSSGPAVTKNAKNQIDDVMEPIKCLIADWGGKVEDEDDLETFKTDINAVFSVNGSTGQLEFTSSSSAYNHSCMPANYNSTIQGKIQNMEVTGDLYSCDVFVIIETTCCGVISVPVGYTPEPSCDEIDPGDPDAFYTLFVTPKTVGDGGEIELTLDEDKCGFAQLAPYDFESYLQLYVEEKLGSSFEYEEYFKGFQPPTPEEPVGEFNKMIYLMLTDPYTTDVHSEDCDVDSWTEPVEEVQYDCEQLWSCWLTVIEAYFGEQGLQTFDGKNNFDDEITDNDESTDDGDDFFSFFQGKIKLPKWLLKVLGWHDPEQITDKILEELEQHTYQGDLVTQFFNCLGCRKFAEVLQPGEGDGQYYPDDFNYDPNQPQQPVRRYYPNNPLAIDPNTSEYYYPNIEDPLYMYKYFVYEQGTNIACERMYCYEAHDEQKPCYPVDCPYGKECWNSQDRCDFYNCIKNGEQLEADHEPEDPPETEELEDMHTAEVDQCLSNCEKRRAYWKNQVVAALEAKNYVFHGCETDPLVISMESVDGIVDFIVQSCINACNNLSMPQIVQSDCDEKTFYLIEFDECEMLEIERFILWEFNMDMTNDGSQPSCDGSQNPCDETENSDEYSTSITY